MGGQSRGAAQSERRQRPSQFQWVEGLGEEPLTPFWGHRLFTSAISLGVLIVQQGDHRRFSEDEEAFLITVSAQLAGLIAHAELAGAISQTSPITEILVPVRGCQASPLARESVLARRPGLRLHADFQVSHPGVDRSASRTESVSGGASNVRADIQQVAENLKKSSVQKIARCSAYI